MKIVAVKQDKGQDIEAVKLDDGSVHQLADAIAMAKNNQIEGVNVGKDRLGRETLRSYPDGDPSNNLANLPKFE